MASLVLKQMYEDFQGTLHSSSPAPESPALLRRSGHLAVEGASPPRPTQLPTHSTLRTALGALERSRCWRSFFPGGGFDSRKVIQTWPPHPGLQASRAVWTQVSRDHRTTVRLYSKACQGTAPGQATGHLLKKGGTPGQALSPVFQAGKGPCPAGRVPPAQREPPDGPEQAPCF